jgi:redox-sensing transcriptional repressor
MTPEKTLERFIIYRLILSNPNIQGQENIFSSQIAKLTGNTSTQVRRDLMVLGVQGHSKNGYSVREIIESIQRVLEPEEGIPMVLTGIGNLGRAILGYFATMKPRFNLLAAFDKDPDKVNRVIAGCHCYPLEKISEVLTDKKVEVGIIAVPSSASQSAADALVKAGVKGLVHFDTAPIIVPKGVYLENMRMNLLLEKVAFFVRQNQKEV